jgi:LuxR family maltose regulon positive regulatory protein
MRGQPDKSNFIAHFTGKDRLVVDYLLEEVFQGQPEQIQHFLVQTSLLDRLTGPLCDAVTGQDNGQETLERLEKTNLFIVPLDNERQWYRYHHLFGGFLRGRLQQQQAEILPDRHLRAARWFIENGLLDEAIDHTLKAGAFEQAAALIEQAVETTLRLRGEAMTFLGWLEALPAPVIHSRPRLCLAQAWALFNTGQWTQVEPLLQQVERTLVSAADNPTVAPLAAGHLPELQGEMAALRAELALFEENSEQALALSSQALAYLPPENLLLRSMATQVQGFTYRLQGEVTQARRVLAEASTLSQTAGNLTFAIFALSDLAEVQVMQGQLRQAAQTFQRIMNLASEHRAWPFPPTGTAYVGMGNLLREWNELDTAVQHLRKGIELSQQGGYVGVASLGYLILAQVKQAQGETGSAFDLLRQAEKLIGPTGSHRLRTRVALTRAWLWLRQGEVTAAGQWARDYEQSQAGGLSSPAYQRQVEQTTLARVRLAQGQPDITLLAQLLQTAEAAGWQQNVLELLVLQALALEAQGETAKALAVLKRALTLAEPEGYIRLFIDEGAPMAKLLRLVVAQGILPTYVGQLQASFMPAISEKALSRQALIDPLTERELSVLQFMAAGLSNQEIADELVLALGTVARYTNNIFTKLNVRNRTQAIARAQALGLI